MDLAAEVQQKRAVGDALDLDARDVGSRRDDPVGMLGVGREHADVADLRPRVDANKVDRVEQPACVCDCARETGEAARAVVEPGPKREAVRGGVVSAHAPYCTEVAAMLRRR